MAALTDQAGESPLSEGGAVPGAHDQPAFVVRAAEPSVLPVLIAVPHAGRSYPDSIVHRMRHPRAAALRLEDRYADLLGEAVAAQTGAALLIARAPRAMIDLNRATDDVDWSMFAGSRAGGSDQPIGLRARSGLGLIPRRLPGLGEIWKDRHQHGDLDDRLTAIHEPYHTRLEQELARLRKRWGAALLVDLHSMPPLGLHGPHPPSEFVIGDRFGASCHGTLVAEAFGHFGQMQRTASHNRPYAGGYVLDRHASVSENIHALQLEVDRSSYLDRALVERGAGFDDMVEVLCGLVLRLSERVAELGRSKPPADWAIAAE